MKAVITGGAGFIGSHLADALISVCDEIVIIDNCSTGRFQNIEHLAGRVKFIESDISTLGNWESEFNDAKWVFHLAALADIVPSIQNPEGYFKSNVVGTFNVLNAARKYKVSKIIYSASSSCYGIPTVYPTPETAAIDLQYPYALTKRLAEEMVLHWSKLYDIPALSLRFFNVYGPRSRTSGTYGAVFGVFLAQKLAGAPFTVVGDGNQTRDFTYVSDIVDALISAAKSNITGEIFNVGSGKTVSINKLVELLGGDKVHIPKRPGEPDCTFADISKIKKNLDWLPRISLEEGVQSVLKNIDYWREAPVWTPESIAGATSDWFRYLGK